MVAVSWAENNRNFSPPKGMYYMALEAHFAALGRWGTSVASKARPEDPPKLYLAEGLLFSHGAGEHLIIPTSDITVSGFRMEKWAVTFCKVLPSPKTTKGSAAPFLPFPLLRKHKPHEDISRTSCFFMSFLGDSGLAQRIAMAFFFAESPWTAIVLAL